jgi:hypothetical protein
VLEEKRKQHAKSATLAEKVGGEHQSQTSCSC